MRDLDKEFIEGLSDESIWEGPLARKKTLEAIDDAWASKDSEEMKRLWSDLSNEQMQDIWYVFREFSKKRADIKRMLGVENG